MRDMSGRNIAHFRLRKIVAFDNDKRRPIDKAKQFLKVTGFSTESKVNMLDLAGENLSDEVSNKNHFEKETISAENAEQRPKSEPVTNFEVLNLPLLHESHGTVNSELETRDIGTIKRPHDGELLRPLVVQAFTKPKLENEMQLYLDDNDYYESASNFDVDSTKSAENLVNTGNGTISPFPPVDDDEIDKHRHLNEEAEKNGKSKPPPNRHQHYLNRLQLERKQVSVDKLKDVKIKKKMLKRVQTKPKIAKDVNDLFVENPPPPPKPKEIEPKSVKLILGFRYSYAIEQYYRGKMKSLGSGITFSSSINGENRDSRDKEDVLNGWVVKSLGPNVLNMQARTLPSCNPIELRLRRQQARMRQPGRSRGRTLSNESRRSTVLLRSHDSLSKLNTIEEGAESRNFRDETLTRTDQYSKERKISTSQSVDVQRFESVPESELVLPPIRSPNKLIQVTQTIKKAISLKLPPIGTNEGLDNFATVQVPNL